jgi:uncharacterized membrane protein
MTGRVILIAVLALSLLGNALALGAGLRFVQLRHALMGESASTSLSIPMRRELIAILADHKADLAPALQAMQTARLNAVEAISAKDYDPEATKAALDALRQSVTGLMEQAQVAVLDGLAKRPAN